MNWAHPLKDEVNVAIETLVTVEMLKQREMVTIRDVMIKKGMFVFKYFFLAGVMTEVSPSAFNESVFALYVTFHFYYTVLLLQSIAFCNTI